MRISGLKTSNNISKKVAVWGTRISLSVLLTGLATILFNNRIMYISEYITYIGQELMKTSFVLLVETVIGVIIFEAFLSPQSGS